MTAQAFLFSAEDNEALSYENNATVSLIPSEQEMQDWRNKGPLGKLHNIVVYIQRSPQRIASFEALTSGKRIPRDNKTRWNSWYAMIDCAISIRMKPAIDVFCAQEGLEADALTPSDWTTLGHFHKYLKFFYQATLATEGYEATIDRVLSTMEFLLEKLEAAKVEFKEDAFLSPCVNSAWKKLDKYYGLTERSSAYTAAMVMVPSQKWTWIEDNWENYWIKIAKKQVQELWDTEYKPVQLPPPPRVEISIEEKTEHQIWLEQKRRRPLVLDEYMKYCESPITSDFNARAWWMEPAQRAAFPNLGKMALDLLSIPAMSASPERLFSSAGLTITERRNRLGTKSIEALECLKSWYRIVD